MKTMNISEIKGVNLGGWLVLERWITPHIFQNTDATDEYSLSIALGTRANEYFDKHRRTFITEQTIARVAEAGLNTVRLPVGYWLFGGVGPFADGAHKYVDQLFNWAEKYEIKVILDLHAAPGSQNGWDHSGRSGELGWHKSKENVESTLRFLSHLCEEYGHRSSLLGIEVLNEPRWDVPIDILMDYYLRAYEIVRMKCPVKTVVIFSDAFRHDGVSRQLADANLANIALDMHFYQLFTDEDRELDLKGHLRKATNEWSKMIHKASARMPVVVGEWSAALDESRYTFTHADYRAYALAQINAFESCDAGWVYWTAKVQGGGAWSLLDNPDFVEN